MFDRELYPDVPISGPWHGCKRQLISRVLARTRARRYATRSLRATKHKRNLKIMNSGTNHPAGSGGRGRKRRRGRRGGQGAGAQAGTQSGMQSASQAQEAPAQSNQSPTPALQQRPARGKPAGKSAPKRQFKPKPTAHKLNVKVNFVKSDKEVLELVAAGEEKPALIIIDLNHHTVKPLVVIPKLKAKFKKETNIIGFLSHLQGELKVKAQEAGCDMVLPRSAFSQNLPQLLRRHATSEAEMQQY